MSEGAIIVRHLGYEGIAMDDVLRSLPESARAGDRVSAEIDQRAPLQRALATRDWAEAQRDALGEFDRLVKPLLDKYPSFRVHYFGTASIPLMMLLGMKVGTWRAVDAYNHHHTRKSWTWDDPAAPAPSVDLDLDGLPRKASPASGDVVVRIAVSYAIAPQLTHAQVPQPIGEIDLGVKTPSLDVLVSPAGVDTVARRFREALDAIHEKLPNATVVHVFAAVPPGVAFRMGTSISETMHARTQAYEFERKGATNGYYPAFVLQQPASPKLIPNPSEIAVLERLADRDLPKLAVHADPDAGKLVLVADPVEAPDQTRPRLNPGVASLQTGEARMTADDLFNLLSKLLPTQFEAVLFRTRVPIEYLPTAIAPQAERAIATIRHFELQGRLDQLARAVHQILTGDEVGANPR